MSRFKPALLLLFVGSGFAALVYEVVWFHLLQLVIGASSISLAVLLGSFMGGMCLGSIAFGRLVSRKLHPLRVYAWLEFGIGGIGLVLLFLLPLIGRIYLTSVGYGLEGILFRGFIAAICLLPPTVLMGATLPAIARWIRTTRIGVSQLGFFYGANIVGAVLGTFLTGFFLLRLFDTVVATYVAISVNLLVGAVALRLAARSPFEASDLEETDQSDSPAPIAPYVVIALSGLTALGAEVVWTRQLSLLFGTTVYNFSLILLVFLSGLGIGSTFGAVISKRTRAPADALGRCQLLLVPAILWGSILITDRMPYWQPNDEFLPWILESTSYIFAFDMIRCTIAMLPATILWGASFPLALAAVARRGDPGRLVGGIYGANTAGAIVGSLFFTMIWIPMAGTRSAQQAFMVIAAGAALLMLGSKDTDASGKRPEEGTEATGSKLSISYLGSLAFVLVVTLVLVAVMPATPQGLIAYGRFIEYWGQDTEFLYTAEGIDASVAVSEFEGERSMHVAGKVVASNVQIDMRLQRMLGHMPALVHEKPRSVLIVGCGAGVTAGSFVVHPDIERIVICEIEKRVPEAAAEFFGTENYDVLNDPRTELVIDDARHFLATTDEKFDIITSDPIHPWVRGAAAMYSAEYFEMVREHLNPGGVVTQWVPLYETSEDAVKSQLATFVGAFPDATVWTSDIFGGGYDVFILGQDGPTTIQVEDMDRRMRESPVLYQSLIDVDLESAVDLLGAYGNRAPDMAEWLSDAQLNSDRNLRLQYLAGLHLDRYVETDIYKAMTTPRQYPSDIFLTENPFYESALREAFRQAGLAAPN
jgi:spermidine synthase